MSATVQLRDDRQPDFKWEQYTDGLRYAERLRHVSTEWATRVRVGEPVCTCLKCLACQCFRTTCIASTSSHSMLRALRSNEIPGIDPRRSLRGTPSTSDTLKCIDRIDCNFSAGAIETGVDKNSVASAVEVQQDWPAES